jgi:hypothetical protein
MIGQGYEYRKGYLKYKDSIGLVTFSQSIQTVNLSGQLTEVCAQLWLASDQFPPPANTSLFPSRASSDSTIRDWYWNTLFSDFFAQDVDQLLINDFPAISLMIWPAELNQEISSAFFIDYEQDPRVISPFDPSVSGFAFQVSYLPWDIELVSKDPEPEDYDALDRWENECESLEEALNSLWYIDTLSFSEVIVTTGGSSGISPFNLEVIIFIIFLGGVFLIGFFIYQRSQNRVPSEFAHYFEVNNATRVATAPPRVLETKCAFCGEVIVPQSQFCLYCGKKQ